MGTIEKYTNVIFLKEFCSLISDKVISNETGIKVIDQKIKQATKYKQGKWPRPKEETSFIELLKSMRTLLENDIAGNILYDYVVDAAFGSKNDEPKCKIAFMVHEVSAWPCVEHLYRAAACDDRFEATAVYVPFAHTNSIYGDTNLRTYSDMGIPVVNYTDYNLSAENPDIVVFIKPYNNIPPNFCMREVEKIVKRVVYIPYGLELTKSLIRYAFHEYTHYRAWKHLAYGNIVKEIGTEYGYRNGENIAVWGHPRVDNYLTDHSYKIPNTWKKKIGRRKVVLWCPHHTIVSGSECVSTWLDYYEDIFRMFEKRSDLILLWRPHPLLFGAIINNGYMTESDLKSFIAEKTSCGNVILDQESDYRLAFSVSDAIITDGTTFALEYLLTDKPLMVTAHSLEQFYNSERFGNAIYWAQNTSDIERFLNNVTDGHDPRKSVRNEFKNETFFIPENQTVSQYILDQIITELIQEEKWLR